MKETYRVKEKDLQTDLALLMDGIFEAELVETGEGILLLFSNGQRFCVGAREMSAADEGGFSKSAVR